MYEREREREGREPRLLRLQLVLRGSKSERARKGRIEKCERVREVERVGNPQFPVTGKREWRVGRPSTLPTNISA